MSDATPFWRQLREAVNEELDKRLNAIPGLTPGVYNGLTIDRYGRVTLAKPGGGGGMSLLALYELSSNTNRTAGSTARINFNTLLYDPTGCVTTGASWHFTPPADAAYMVCVSTRLIQAAAFFAGEKILMYLDSVGGTTANLAWYPVTVDETARPDEIIFQGSKTVLLYTTDTLNVRIQNGTSSSISQRGASDEGYSTVIAIYKVN